MADEQKKPAAKKEAKAPEVNEYGQTEEMFKEAHGGRSPEEVNSLGEEPDEDHHKAKKEARWG